jgi:putative ABC transport system permease protein
MLTILLELFFKADINGGKINESVSMPPVAQTMKKDFPEVQDATRILAYSSSKILYKDKVF